MTILEQVAEERLSYAEAKAREFLRRHGRAEGVGARHHVVPRFVLRRFASAAGQVRVRSRVDGAVSTRQVADMGIRDFFTTISDTGPDGRIEQLLAVVDAEMAEILRRWNSSLQPLGEFSEVEAGSLATYLGLQHVRGPRWRREAELMTEWFVKVQGEGLVPGSNVADLTIASSFNHHLDAWNRLAAALSATLFKRPSHLVTLDRPLLFVGDEPMVVVREGSSVAHLPSCFLSPKQRQRKARKARQRHAEHKEIVHFYPTRPAGIADADGVALVVAPNQFVFVELAGRSDSAGRIHFDAMESVEAAQELNEVVVQHSYDWIAAAEGTEGFEEFEMPPLDPVMRVCDGGAPTGRHLNRAPEPRAPQRLWKRRLPA